MTEHRKPEDLSDHDYTTVDMSTRDVATGAVGDTTGQQRKTDPSSGHDYTTVDAEAHDAATPVVGHATAFSVTFADTPTPVAAGGPISSGQITAQNARADESAPPSTAERASNRDETKSTKLDPGFVHLVSGTLVDSYEVEKLLGAGGMGAVYGAHHERLGRRVAIKVISPSLSRDRDAVERFEQEAHALARLSHPNIVSVLSVGTLPGDGRSYYVMEWLDGEALQTRLDRGAMRSDLALYVIDQIARGLEVAHTAGIVHRDLKPDNVWLQYVGNEPQPIVKILDFGLAKLAQHRRTEHTGANVMFGTSAYMSPEQCRSSRDVGPPTDVYALGCLSYELLCGRLPFIYDNAAELVAAHLSEAPPRPLSLSPAIDPSLHVLLTAMLAKDPTQRPTLAHVRSVIANARLLPTSPARPGSPTSAPSPKLPPPAKSPPAKSPPAKSPPGAAATRAPTVLVDDKSWRKAVVPIVGFAVFGAVVIAAVAGSRGASHAKPKRAMHEPSGAASSSLPSSTLAVPDASVAATAAPSVARDPSVPTETPAPRTDASAVTPRPTVDSVVPSIAPLPNGEPLESEPTAAVEPDLKPAVDPSAIDAGVESVDDAGLIEADASVRHATTSPSAHRTPPVAPAKRPTNRDVIVNPFKKKQVTK